MCAPTILFRGARGNKQWIARCIFSSLLRLLAQSTASLAQSESTVSLAALNIASDDANRTVTGVLTSKRTAKDIKIDG